MIRPSVRHAPVRHAAVRRAAVRRALTIVLAAAAPLAAQTPERWDVIYGTGLDGDQRVGHVHTVTDKLELDGQAVLRTRQTTVMGVQRFGDTASFETVVTDYAYPDGTVYAMTSRQRVSGQTMSGRAVLGSDGRMKVTNDTGGKTSESVLDWPEQVYGVRAAEDRLREEKLRPGDATTYKAFLLDQAQVGTFTLTAEGQEETTLLDGGKATLLRVEQTCDVVPITITYWIDDAGEVVKSLLPLGSVALRVYRTTRQEATQSQDGGGFDLGVSTLVKVDRPVPDAHRRASATYTLEFAEPAASQAIRGNAYTTVQRTGPKTLEVTVRRRVPGDGLAADAAAEGVAEEYTAANGFVQSDDPAIVATAGEVAGGKSGLWEKAVALERWVHANLVSKDFSVGFATASEVMQTRQGDCTEHAVLLAALCRAAGIPSRVAMGLVYVQSRQVFGYHMWTEVAVDGVWYPLDGTIGHGGIGAGHLKVADGSLQGTSAMQTFLPILEVIGKLDVKVAKLD